MEAVDTHKNQLKRVRELHGWSQADVAEKLGCDARSVGRWERGVISPSAYYRQKLCLLFEQNMEELGFLAKPIAETQELGPLEQQPLQAEPEQNSEEPGSILHHTPIRVLIGLFLLLMVLLGSFIIYTSFPSNHSVNIPYGKLLYTTTTPGSKCDHGGGQWVDYNQPDIQCSAANSIISNFSSLSPDLRGTLLTNIQDNTYPDNYVLEAQIQQPLTSSDFGLYFRNQPGDQQGIYTFFIHPNGSWGVYVYDNITAAQTQIAHGTASVDPHSQLYLTVVAIGPDFTFYINRQEVGTAHDTTYGAGTVGIAVDAGGTIVVSRITLYRVA